MSSSEETGSLLNEPEKSLHVWLQSNGVATLAAVLAFVILGYGGYMITTNGYEVTGGILLIATITLGCHIAEWARTLFLRRRGHR